MDELRQGDNVAAETLLQPTATKKHLDSVWIGIGLALDWIAMRDQPMPAQDYNARHDEAASALVDLLADMPADIVESCVRGVVEGYPGLLVPIPSGIWRQTAATQSNEDHRPYWLVGVGDDDEDEGVISGPQVRGYRKVQIRADFIADNWPETTLAIVPVKSRPAVAKADIRRTIEQIIAQTPEELRPLANGEITDIVLRRMPHASRDIVRACVRDIQHDPKRGPKGPRQPDRSQKLQEFGGRVLAAKLQNSNSR